MHKCRICGSPLEVAFKEKILQRRYEVSYFKCLCCGLLQTENPYWLDEAYSSPINVSDTGYIKRNHHLSLITLNLLMLSFLAKAKFLDYAAGFGVFVRIMRDYGFDFYWDDKYCSNLFAQTFEKEHQNYDLITCFEAFEHFLDPLEDISNMASMTDSIFFSTELLPEPIPTKNWWYYGFEHGQHINFYEKRTLEFIADKFNFSLVSCANKIHVFSRKKYLLNLFSLAYVGRYLGLANIFCFFLESKTLSDHFKIAKSERR